MPVSIKFGDWGVWNTFGVSGYGIYRYFILYSHGGESVREPAGFNYIQGSATGYGGVLLIGGMNPFTSDTNVPLAYDLSCPVECSPVIRVAVNPTNLEAECPKCHSTYNVTEMGGAATSGPAVAEKYKLRFYQCVPIPDGGYLIINQ